MKIKFTEEEIKKIKPQEKYREYYDSSYRKLGLRISPLGRKTWFYLYKDEDGMTKKFTLGTYPGMKCADAKDEWKKVISKKDPQKKKLEHKRGKRFVDLWNAYTDDSLYLQKAESSRKVELSMYKKHLAQLNKKKLKNLKYGAHIRPILSNIAKTAPITANRVHSLLTAMFSYGVETEIIKKHPMVKKKKPGGSEKSRERTRVLSMDEIYRLWPHLPDYFKLVLLTGQRPGEVLAMKYEEIQEKPDPMNHGMFYRVWTIPAEKTKTRQESVVPLSRLASKIIGQGKGYVFPSCSKQGHIVSTGKARYRIWEKTGVKDWTAHDLRRTAATIMAKKCRVPFYVVNLILNHKLDKITRTYITMESSENKLESLEDLKLEALEKLSTVLKKAITGEDIS